MTACGSMQGGCALTNSPKSPPQNQHPLRVVRTTQKQIRLVFGPHSAHIPAAASQPPNTQRSSLQTQQSSLSHTAETTMTCASLFSNAGQGALYSLHRPKYPQALYEAILANCSSARSLAVDIATGSGQAASALAGTVSASVL